MLVEFVLFFNPFWKYRQRHPHELEVVESSSEIDFFMLRHMYLAPSVLRTLFHSNFDVDRSAVLVKTPRLYFRRFPPGCDLDSIWILFLGSKIDHNLCVSEDHLARICLFSFGVRHDKNGVSPFLTCFVIALRHTPKIFTKRRLPYFHRCRIVHESLVA